MAGKNLITNSCMLAFWENLPLQVHVLYHMAKEGLAERWLGAGI